MDDPPFTIKEGGVIKEGYSSELDDYIVYGFYHGVLMAGFEVYQKKSNFYKKNKNKNWYKLLSWFVTMNLVMIGFFIFSGEPYKILLRGDAADGGSAGGRRRPGSGGRPADNRQEPADSRYTRRCAGPGSRGPSGSPCGPCRDSVGSVAMDERRLTGISRVLSSL